jgi:hypothetical protein
MNLVRRFRLHLLFAGFLVFSSIMVVHQIGTNESRHVEMREAFILLNSRGYRPQAERLYQRLLIELEHLSNKLLLEDFQRTLTLVDPTSSNTENLVWEYHWTVSNELEKRSEASLERALKLAEQQ